MTSDEHTDPPPIQEELWSNRRGGEPAFALSNTPTHPGQQSAVRQGCVRVCVHTSEAHEEASAHKQSTASTPDSATVTVCCYLTPD